MGIEITDFFNMSGDHPLYSEVREILIIAGKSPEQGSEFDKNTKKYRKLPNNKFLDALKKDKYDVLVIHDGEYFHGYAAYQRKGDEMGIFRLEIDEKVEGNPYLISKLIRNSLRHIKNKGIKKINFDRDSKELVDFLKIRENKLDVTVNQKNNSLYFLPMNFETGLF
jgi:hypothetical protein